MDEITQFFAVIVERAGRMYTCPHGKDQPHLTREDADKCSTDNKGIAILEWVKDRRPQFSLAWSSPDLTDEKKAKLPWS